MPVLRYFLWVGGSLLALLFVADFYLPRPQLRTDAPHSYNIPIAAAAPSGPSAVTFSGETRNFGPAPPMTVVDIPAPTDQTPHRAMQANAQMTGAPPTAERAKPARKRVAKRRIYPDRDPAHIPDNFSHDRATGMAFARPFAPFTW